MVAKITDEEIRIVQSCVQRLEEGQLAPWKVEDDLLSTFGMEVPKNFRMAALCRQHFIQTITGEQFRHISVPEKPYKERYQCVKDNLTLELDIRDENPTCSLCASELVPMNQYAPLVANYVGGLEDYISYAGQVVVKGDVQKTFTNLLVYGTGLGPIGVTRGSFLIKKLGGAEVAIEDSARAVRCLGFVFANEKSRQKAQDVIKAFLPEATDKMQKKMLEFGGRISSVDFDHAETQRGFILYVDFVAEFTQFRGHGDISRVVGFIKHEVEEKLTSQGISYALSVIAQGHDGDLKPSPRNKRGRKAMAQARIPLSDFEGILKVDPEKFLAFVEVDCVGSQRLRCPFYSGMGGEILPAIYKATKVNPHSPLVSCFQNISAEKNKGDVIYRVELPNIEVGVLSSREGLMSPVGREAMRIMGIRTAKEFAASVVAQVLAGEFNLALEISREKLYS
jgi:hydroxymethylglutaryl-CoA reductase